MPDDATQLTERFTRAVDMARTIHKDDVRKGTKIPYLAHLLSVAAIVLEHGGSEDDAIAALLHDTAEDHGGRQTIESIRAEFGAGVADVVEACSDTLVADRLDKEPWWDRKVAYLDKLAHEPQAVVLVSAADKLHNARAVLTDYRQIGDELWGRFNKQAGLMGAIWYYTRLSEEITARLSGAQAEPLAEELRSVVDAIGVEAARRGHDVEGEIDRGRATEADVRATLGGSK
jgi:(p)ppGpp synthase/HD superfamily hydrolase